MIQSIRLNGSSSYPGWYNPSSEVKKILHHFNHFAGEMHNTLPVKLQEFEHHYRIIVPIADTPKNDIVVYAHARRIMIALKKRLTWKGRGFYRLPDSAYCCGIVTLPETADVEFSSAECKDGNLEIYLSRTIARQADADHQIIVY